MALAMMALSRAVGQSPMQMARRLGPGVVAFGSVVHLVLSAGFGALFAVVADRLTHEFWMTGLAYALTLWVLNFWGAQITPGGRQMSEAAWAWLSPLAHIVYGGVMAAIAVTFAASAMGNG